MVGPVYNAVGFLETLVALSDRAASSISSCAKGQLTMDILKASRPIRLPPKYPRVFYFLGLCPSFSLGRCTVWWVVCARNALLGRDASDVLDPNQHI